MNTETKFEFGKLRNGEIAITCNSSIPKHIKQVEYYQDCRIFVLTFHVPMGEESDFMIQHEMSDAPAKIIEESHLDSLLMVDASNPGNPLGYVVPLLRLGTRIFH